MLILPDTRSSVCSVTMATKVELFKKKKRIETSLSYQSRWWVKKPSLHPSRDSGAFQVINDCNFPE